MFHRYTTISKERNILHLGGHQFTPQPGIITLSEYSSVSVNTKGNKTIRIYICKDRTGEQHNLGPQQNTLMCIKNCTANNLLVQLIDLVQRKTILSYIYLGEQEDKRKESLWDQLGDQKKGNEGSELRGRKQVPKSDLLERGRGFKGESQIRLLGSDWKLLLMINIHRETKGQDLVQQGVNRVEII